VTLESNYTAKVVRARKRHRCDGPYDGPGHMILPGRRYVRSVVFPGHDASNGKAPWVHRLCVDCAQQYDIPKALIA